MEAAGHSQGEGGGQSQSKGGGGESCGAGQHGLLLDYVAGMPLAAKPTSAHLLRCKWDVGAVFERAAVACMALGVARGLEYMHGLGLCHGVRPGLGVLGF